MAKAPEKSEKEKVRDPLERMNKALKAAMKMPPRKHKDEPKRGNKQSSK